MWEQNAHPSAVPTAKGQDDESPMDTEPIHVREKKLRGFCNKAAYAVACRIEASNRTNKSRQDIVTLIHYEWSSKPGNSIQSRAGLEELELKLEWLNSGKIEQNPSRYLR